MDNLIGHRYLLESTIGAGGMGEVFTAQDRLTGDRVAVKRLRRALGDIPDNSSAGLQTRLALANEFNVLARLRHPNIISVLDYGFDLSNQPYIVMTYVESAQSLVHATQNASLDTQIAILIDLLQALEYLHRHGIVHRDLKPDNVLVAQGRVIVLDFGLAQSNQGTSEQISGTLLYIAPEVLMGQPASTASDLYALGVMTYELLTGKHPYTFADLTRNLVMRTIPFPAMPPHLDSFTPFLQRLIAFEPSGRFATPTECIVELERLVGRALRTESPSIRESFLQNAPFVGRVAQREQLLEALAQTVAQKTGSAWLIGGESGIGKSRLVEEVRIHAQVQKVLILRGQTVRDSAPYSLWREPLRRLILSVPLDDVEAGILHALVPDIETLIGRAIPTPSALTGAADRARLKALVIDLFQRAQEPILLLLEDLHWANEGFDWIAAVVEHCAAQPLMVVATYRHDERPDLPTLLPAMHAHLLRRLSMEEIQELSIAILGAETASSAMQNLLERETEGNTFFVVEVLRALAERAGGLAYIAASTLPHRVFTHGIQQIVRQRLMRLPEADRAHVQLAAIIGRQIQLPVMATEIDSEALAAWLRRCAEVALLEVVDGEWRFVHDKMREGLLLDISADAQTALHRHAAQALTRAYGDHPDHLLALAHHWEAAGDFEAAGRVALLARPQLLPLGNYAQAHQLYSRILGALPPTAPIYPALLNVEGDTLFGLGNFAGARAFYEQVASLDPTTIPLTEAARARVGLARVITYEGDYDLSREFYQQGLTLYTELGDKTGIARCHSDLFVLAVNSGDYATARTHIETSIALYRAINDRRGIAHNLSFFGNLAEAEGDLASAEQFTLESMAIHRELGSRQGVAIALFYLSNYARLRGDLDQALSYIEECARLYQAIGDRYGLADTLTRVGLVLASQGKLKEARTQLRQALSIGSTSKVPSHLIETLGIAAGMLVQEGKLTEAALWLHFVMQHPQAQTIVIDQMILDRYAEVEARLPADQWAQARQEAQTRTVEDAYRALDEE